MVGKQWSAEIFLSLADRLLCIDSSVSRLSRLRNVLSDFAFGIGSGRAGMPDVEVAASTVSRRGELFSRVFVDVPCSTDRDALTEPLSRGGYFAKGKTAARVALTKTQKSLLQ